MKNLTAWCVGLALTLSTAISCATDANQFVSVKGMHFEHDGKSYYIAGANMWYGGYLGAPTSVGDRARLIKELDNLQAMGINNLRVLAVSEKSDLHSAVHPAITNGFGNYDENLLIGLDYLLSEMAKRHMTAVLYLNNFWQWSGGMTQYMSWINGRPVQDPNVTGDYQGFMKESAAFYQNEKAQQEYRNTIRKIVTRTNTITGKPYVDDPAIMSWQLANEPRPGNDKASAQEKAVYVQWVNNTAKYIHQLDNHHLVCTGSEGLKGSANDMQLYKTAHQSKYVDYLTYHLWPRNWSWYDQKHAAETWNTMWKKSKEYLNVHIDAAKKIGKPIVLEEFGLDRDDGAYDPKATTHYRDRFYRDVLAVLYQRARAGDAIAGFNFWAWNGMARTHNADYWWKTGDAFMGDPPQEQQGMYGVFDSDTSTILIIREFAGKFRALQR